MVTLMTRSKNMNLLLWILQVLLALHTAAGAVWKWSNSETPCPLCVVALIAPAFSKRLAILAPIAAAVVAAVIKPIRRSEFA
jgi:hypothetical protein